MSELAIRVEHVSKLYRLYTKPLHRFLDMYGLLPRSKSKYREHPAVNDVSFEIERGEKVAIIGRNGAGKSTLLKMICGVVAPSSGALHVNGEIHALLSLGTGFHPDFTGRENIYSHLAHLGIGGAMADRYFHQIVDFSELHDFIDQPVKTYSAGMGMRLMFSAASVITPDILVIDEVLGAGDAYFSRKSFERMKELCEGAGTTLVMVTHDMYAASTFCERMIWIDRGHIKMDGPSKGILRAYEESIRDQEEQRLRSSRIAAVEANLASQSERSQITPAYLRLDDSEKEGPDFSISGLRFYRKDELLGELNMSGEGLSAGTKPMAATVVLDDREGNWGPFELVGGRSARPMLPYGSIFHKLPMLIKMPEITESASEGTLEIEACVYSNRPQALEFAMVDGLGSVMARTTLETQVGGWRDIRAQVRLVNASELIDVATVASRHGQRSMEITNVRFEGADRSERLQFPVGSFMRIRLSYRINKPKFSERPTILAAFQQNGIVRSHRFWTDSILISAEDATEGELEIVADPLLLGAGTYFVTISVFAEGYIKSLGPKKFFSANDQLYDMHARAYEIVVTPSAREPFCNDVIFQHPCSWFRNSEFAAQSEPVVDEPAGGSHAAELPDAKIA